MTAAEWAKTVQLEFVSSAHWHNIIADLAACERERDALKARLAEARWLVENATGGFGTPSWHNRRDAWLKEVGSENAILRKALIDLINATNGLALGRAIDDAEVALGYKGRR